MRAMAAKITGLITSPKPRARGAREFTARTVVSRGPRSRGCRKAACLLKTLR
ncbi:MAG: hypothetical protein GMKNLPBB_01544 [Myxococcota bacterium]|nr:hypothetical protein [Myxococcota bacterium]